MPKLSIYVSETLAADAASKKIPVSTICQEALRRATYAEAKCAEGGKGHSATKYLVVRSEGHQVVVCSNHLHLYLGDKAEVIAL